MTPKRRGLLLTSCAKSWNSPWKHASWSYWRLKSCPCTRATNNCSLYGPKTRSWRRRRSRERVNKSEPGYGF
jgi:hypothetical protein